MSYIGPGDIIGSAAGWYGLRAYNAAYAAPGTNPCADLRRVSDNATMTMNILPTGIADVATVTTWVGASSAVITKLYDQSGNGIHMYQGTAAAQPALLLSSVNGLPAISFSGSQYLLGAASYSINSPSTVSISCYAQKTAASDGGFLFLGNSGSNVYNGLGNNGGNGHWYLFGSTTSGVAAADSIWHSAQGVISNGTNGGLLSIDGVNTSITTGIANSSAIPVMGRRIDLFGTSYLIGQIAEIGWWSPLTFSNAQITQLTNNQQNYYANGTENYAIADTNLGAITSAGVMIPLSTMQGSVTLGPIIPSAAITSKVTASAALLFGSFSDKGTASQTNKLNNIATNIGPLTANSAILSKSSIIGNTSFGAIQSRSMIAQNNNTSGTALIGAISAKGSAFSINTSLASLTLGALQTSSAILQKNFASSTANFSPLLASGTASFQIAGKGQVSFEAVNSSGTITQSNLINANLNIGNMAISSQMFIANTAAAKTTLGNIQSNGIVSVVNIANAATNLNSISSVGIAFSQILAHSNLSFGSLEVSGIAKAFVEFEADRTIIVPAGIRTIIVQNEMPIV